MEERRKRGDETWHRLLEWSEAHKASERLAGHILRAEGFNSIDPSHPLGGPDNLKDIVCVKEGLRWVASAYFPRGEHSYSDIRSKFEMDLPGAAANSAQGFAFVTNQYLTLDQRDSLIESANPIRAEIFHLERIVGILNSPPNYGTRLEYLDIEMTKEEQVGFFAQYTSSMDELRKTSAKILAYLSQPAFQGTVPLAELQVFKSTLESIVGMPGFYSSFFEPPIARLTVPLQELKQFETILDRITGGQYPQFAFNKPAIQVLKDLPLDLMQLSQQLSQVIWQLEEAKKLKDSL